MICNGSGNIFFPSKNMSKNTDLPWSGSMKVRIEQQKEIKHIVQAALFSSKPFSYANVLSSSAQLLLHANEWIYEVTSSDIMLIDVTGTFPLAAANPGSVSTERKKWFSAQGLSAFLWWL